MCIFSLSEEAKIIFFVVLLHFHVVTVMSCHSTVRHVLIQNGLQSPKFNSLVQKFYLQKYAKIQNLILFINTACLHSIIESGKSHLPSIQ